MKRAYIWLRCEMIYFWYEDPRSLAIGAIVLCCGIAVALHALKVI